MIPTDEETLQAHCRMVINRMARGHLVPFFGAGVNLASRPPHAVFTRGQYLPDSKELSESIAAAFNYPWTDRHNLLRVSWHAAIDGPMGLYRHLHDIFSDDYPTNDVHKFFAQLPGKLLEKGYRNPHQLIVTTNYDDVLERAFDEAGEPYDMLSYVALSEEKSEEGKFKYTPHGGRPEIIRDPTNFDLPIEDNVLERTIILKIHGAVDRAGWLSSSFVVTEDDYIDYLARMKKEYHLPSLLMQKMKYSNFLFLGYRLSDWNLRVLFNSIWAGQRFTDTSWAIMHETEAWDRAYWLKHRVRVRELPLRDYVAALNEQLAALPVVGGGVLP